MQNLILFASGAGSNIRAISAYFKENEKVNIALIVCNNTHAGVLDFAKEENIQTLMIDKALFTSPDFVNKLQDYKPDLIVLAGFLWKVPAAVVAAFPEKIINLHPALLPKYGGKGMYGERVHLAVKAACERETGITIHFIDEHFDEGSNIVQAYCKLRETDEVADIVGKIRKLEHYFLPRTIAFLLNYK